MLKNNKGFTGLELAAIGAIGFVVVTVVYPLVKPFMPGGSDGGQKTTQTESYTETMEAYTEKGEPVKIKLSDGSEGLIFKRAKSLNKLNQQIRPRKPFLERVFLWFARLGILGGLLALVFPAAAATAWWWISSRFSKLKLEMNSRKQEAENLKVEAKRIVFSIDEGVKAFKTQIDAAQALMDATTDAGIKATQASIISSITKARDGFLNAMSIKQDQSTKDLVKALRITDPSMIK